MNYSDPSPECHFKGLRASLLRFLPNFDSRVEELERDDYGRPLKYCVYCGDWNECRDYVIPIAWLRVYRDYRTEETVPCCSLCNSLASSFKAETISEKADYLIDRYERRFRRVLALPPWSMSELAELKGALKSKIKANAALQELIRAKIRNLELVSTGFSPLPLRVDDSRKYIRLVMDGDKE